VELASFLYFGPLLALYLQQNTISGGYFMKKLVQTLILFLAMLFVVVPAFASNITIYDENGYRGTGTGFEDEETEPGMDTHQVWDLEGFFLEEDHLSVVGGFNFKEGQSGYTSGDIFISKDRPTFGATNNSGTAGNIPVFDTYGYDYVLDLDFGTWTYNVISLGAGTEVLTTYYAQNQGSNPWKYVSGGTKEISGKSFSFLEGLTDAGTGFRGITHYALTGFDRSFLGHDTDFYAHFTMRCGNDNLMGQGTVVPEPATLILLGSGLAGLVFYRRKKK